MTDDRLLHIVHRFAVDDEIGGIEPLEHEGPGGGEGGGGHINESYRVMAAPASGRMGERGEPRYLLQRLNPAVFPDGARVMENVANITRHIGRRLEAAGIADWRRRTLTLTPAREGTAWHREPDGVYWRLYHFIPRSRTYTRARTAAQAGMVAQAFGAFLRLVADYRGPPLHETIRGFHDTAARFAALDAAVCDDVRGRVAHARAEIERVERRRDLAGVLPPLIRSGRVPTRVVHNDAKMANVLFDASTGAPLCVIDLDTVMPGSALHDFGDLVRSTVSPAHEDERNLSRVRVRLPVFETLASAYLAEAGALLTPAERSLLPVAGRIITLEQGVRFLTDYLNGDRYYRITRAEQNLDRCRAQLALLESMEYLEEHMERIVESQGG
jgi:hypothetical protein